jgi:hypothetical protein
MVLTTAMILWFIMLCLVVQFVPVSGTWGKVILWVSLVLLSIVLFYFKVLRL